MFEKFPFLPGAIALLAQIIVIITGWITIKSQIKKENDKMATKSYVDKEIETLEKETGLRIEILLQSNEETKATIEAMAAQVNFIYKKHYKP